MRIFLSEYLTCGACSTDRRAEASLAVEGAAMIRALAGDAAAVPGWQVVVTWNATLEPFDVRGVEVLACTRDEEQDLFRRLSAEADVTLVIAPEFQRLLEARSRMLVETGGRSAASTPGAIALCGDKLALAAHLARYGVPTIETRPCDFEQLDDALATSPSAGFVIKPRFGAGAAGLFRVRNRPELAAARAAYAAGQPFGEPLAQPFVRGVSFSIAAVISAFHVELFPIARQKIIGEHRLKYAGGSLPAAIGHDEAVADLARRSLAAIPGLRGYVGIDLLLREADHGAAQPVVVEINPRLTTSYLGYRLLAAENLAERLLVPDTPRPPVQWRSGSVEFECDGTATLTRSRPPRDRGANS